MDELRWRCYPANMTNTQARRHPKDNLGRRVRGRRTPSGKRLILQPRDIEIFKLLRRYRYLRSTTLWELLNADIRGRSFKRFQDRLTNLFHETHTAHGGAYLDWPQQQRLAYNARYTPSIYALSLAGEAFLMEEGIRVANASDLVCDGRMNADREFPHAMMICETLASIELGTHSVPNIRFVPWPEIMAKAPQKIRNAHNPFAIPVEISHTFKNAKMITHEKFNLIPDGLFGLEYKQPHGKCRYRFFALEAERRNRVNTGTLRGSSFLKKVLAYRHIIDGGIHTSHFGIPNLMVLTVAPSVARIRTMTQTVIDLHGKSGSPYFLFNAIPVLGMDIVKEQDGETLFTKPWIRAHATDFVLNNSNSTNKKSTPAKRGARFNTPRPT